MSKWQLSVLSIFPLIVTIITVSGAAQLRPSPEVALELCEDEVV